MKITRALFFVFAFGALMSCSKTEENVPLTPPTAEITVDELVREASLRNQIIPFKVINEDGEDVTEITTFYVDGTAIEGSTFSSETVGEFEVYGVYTQEGVETTTNTEDFRVIIPKRKVVVEDYTGTWCGFCPRVAAAIWNVEEVTHDVAIVAIHETANYNPDPMHFPQVEVLKNAFGVAGLPAARVNRTIDWNVPYDTSVVTSMAGEVTDSALAIKSHLDENELTVEVEIVYENGAEAGDKLVIYLVENGILYDQTNYYNTDESSPFYGLGDPIPDFVHNDVLRHSFTGVLGDEISGAAPLETYTKTLSVVIPGDYVVDNLKIIAMIVKEDNTAKNAQFAEIGESKSYE